MISRPVIELLIQKDEDPDRFERFANDLVSRLTENTVLDTLKGPDLGRDGKTVGSALPPIEVLATLRKDWERKLRDDLTRRRQEGAAPATRFFGVISTPLLEGTIRAAESRILEAFGSSATLTILSGAQLVGLADDYPEDFLRHYGADYEAFVSELSSAKIAAPESTEAILLALATFAAPDSREIRSELYRQGILLVLRDAPVSNPGAVAKRFSELFRTSRPIPESVAAKYVESLKTEGLISQTEPIALTDKGLHLASSILRDSTEERRLGENILREELERLLGQRLADDQFQRIWTVLERELSELFYSRGNSFTDFVQRLLSADQEIDASEDERDIVRRIAVAAAATTAYSPLNDEIQAAVENLFWQRSTRANEWLSDLCVGYTFLCTLGFESSVRSSLISALQNCSLALDTDVVLSLICEGEPLHAALKEFMDRWTKLRGQTLIASVVLEEVAHHAIIANRDFAYTKELLPGSPDDRDTLIENAFVRAFATLMDRGKARLRQWDQYIRMYNPANADNPNDKGAKAAAVRAISENLRTDYRIELLAGASPAADIIQERIFSHLMSRHRPSASERAEYIFRDKGKRDAQLYAALAQRAELERGQAPPRSIALMSSAKRLIELEREFGDVGEVALIVAPSAVIYALSAIPEVAVGRTALRTFLFDPVRHRFSSGLERTVLRSLKAAKSLQLPFAKRAPLMRELRASILSGSPEGREGRADEKLLKEPEELPRRIGAALDALAVKSATANENLELRQEIARLRRELEDAKLQLSQGSRSGSRARAKKPTRS
jgi:predicted nucleic acid-binding protein